MLISRSIDFNQLRVSKVTQRKLFRIFLIINLSFLFQEYYSCFEPGKSVDIYQMLARDMFPLVEKNRSTLDETALEMFEDLKNSYEEYEEERKQSVVKALSKMSTSEGAYRGRGAGDTYRGRGTGDTYRGRGTGDTYRGRGTGDTYKGRGAGSSYRGRGAGDTYRGRGAGSSYRGRGGGSSYRSRGGGGTYRGRGADGDRRPRGNASAELAR